MSLYGRVILGNFAHPTLQRGEHKAQGLLHLQHPQHHLQHLQHHLQHLQDLQLFEPIHLQLSNECALGLRNRSHRIRKITKEALKVLKV